MSEKHRPSGGQADNAGIGEMEGDGDESLVNGEEGEPES